MNKKSREQSIEELTLMLIYLTRFQDNNDFCRYMENSWKGYDFDTLEKLEKEDILWQPKKSKCVYLTENGKEQARILLKEYNLADKDLYERFEFRTIRPDETEQAIEIEQICFPPNESCSPESMRKRTKAASELFLVAEDKSTGRLAGFLNGLATDEAAFRDEFFTDISLYDPRGRNVMLLGLDVLPQYRGQGLAREMMYEYARREREKGRQMLILTCLPSRIRMYRKFGFLDRGIASSTWGGEQWHEMSLSL